LGSRLGAGGTWDGSQGRPISLQNLNEVREKMRKFVDRGRRGEEKGGLANTGGVRVKDRGRIFHMDMWERKRFQKRRQ